jgi:hypothetical protein
MVNGDDHTWASSLVFCFVPLKPTLAGISHYEAHIDNTGHHVLIITKICRNGIIIQLEKKVGKGTGSITAWERGLGGQSMGIISVSSARCVKLRNADLFEIQFIVH